MDERNYLTTKEIKMGQYYKPMILDKNNKIYGTVYSHDYGNGLKLMEHSYIGNSVVKRIEHEITGPGKANRVLWAGDYADDEPGTRGNMYSIDDETTNLPCIDGLPDATEIRYLLNWDKMEAVVIPPYVPDTWVIHPLPLLTCEGNGRGFGDFRGKNKYVGTWARNEVNIQDQLPLSFKLIEPLFKEG